MWYEDDEFQSVLAQLYDPGREWLVWTHEDRPVTLKGSRDQGELWTWLRKHRPRSLHIGPVRRHAIVGREFAVDLDITDFDGERTCCSGVKYCRGCWASCIQREMGEIEALVEEYFGASGARIEWFYSGRRGVHGWIFGVDRETTWLSVSGRQDLLDRWKARGHALHLDEPVTTTPTHWIKTPLGVHKETGKRCARIDRHTYPE